LQGDDKVKPEPRKKADETPVKEQRPPANNSEKKGKKRDRSGKVIASKPNGTPADRAKASRPKNALEQEIYAVGGTQDDYDLLAGVESGSEIEGEDAPTSLGLTKAGDDELRKDLATLLGGGSRSRPTASSKKAELPQRKKKEPAAQESKPAKPSATNQKGKKAVAENAKAKPQPQSTSTSNKRNLVSVLCMVWISYSGR
jgi:ribosome biogenesis protein MAK21